MRFPRSRCWWSSNAVLLALWAVSGSLDRVAAEPQVRPEPALRQLSIEIDPGDITMSGPEDALVIGLATHASGRMDAGQPNLPVMRLVLWLDEDFQATGLEAVRTEEVALGSHHLAPVPPADGDVAIADPTVYASDQPFPDRIAKIEGEGWLRGRRLVHLLVYPVTANPVTGEVLCSTEIEIELIGQPAPAQGLKPRPVPWEAKVDEGLERLAIDLRQAPPAFAPTAGGPEEFWSPTFRPTTDGSPVEYLVVTSEAMAPAFQELADWKTERGVPAVVRTLEWVQATYPNGVDRAEQLRFFLADAHENWGTLWVLLGGDTDVIPVRFATHTFGDIPSDLYYACLDGNWNANGNAMFGEAPPPGFPAGGDSVDFHPELNVGRAPVASETAAEVFVQKVIRYKEALALSSHWPASALLLGERLAPPVDGAEFCEDLLQWLPPSSHIVRMYEEFQNYPGSIPLLKEEVIDSLNAGFGIVHHVGHGYRNTMSVGNATLNNADIDALANGDRLSVVYAINCASNSIDFNSIGERFLKNPNGGGVAYIGASRVAFPLDTRSFQNEFYKLVFRDSMTAIGQAFTLSKVPFIGGAGSDNPIRWMEYGLLLLGDPEMPVWRRAPAPITVTSPSVHLLGAADYTVTAMVGGSPLAGAEVALLKMRVPPEAGVEAFATGVTDGAGMATLPWNPETTGTFRATVSRADYIRGERLATVTSTTGVFFHFVDVTVDDDSVPPSAGNGDGIPDAGETVEVQARLKNAGGGSSTNVSATLSVLTGAEHVTVISPTVNYGNLAPGGQSIGSSPFVLALDAGAPDAFQPLLGLAITSDQGSSSDTFVLPVYGVEIEHYSHLLDDPVPGGNANGLPEPGESIIYEVTARNNGTGQADGVGFTLRALNRVTMLPDPDVVVTDPSASFGTLLPGALVTGDPVAFDLGAGVDVNDLLLELSWSDSHGPRGMDFCDLVPPDAVDQLTVSGAVSSITLTWEPPDSSDVRGYDIYRSNFPESGFVRINSHTAVGSSTYEDPNLEPLTRYYYYVKARDSSFNESVSSPMISATTTPPFAAGWPIEMGQETAAGVVVDDLDRDGDYEIVTGADAIYAWHHDGTEVRDGDNNPITSGVFTLDGSNTQIGYRSTPAIADLTGDGDLEIIGVAWKEAEVYVWNLDGSVETGWPQPLLDVNQFPVDFNWASAAVADLDLDGLLEIVAVAGEVGIIYAWHHNGAEVVDGDGNPFTLGIMYLTGSVFLYSSPAIGSIDVDPFPEIVFGTQTPEGKVYALSHAGQVQSGWPVHTIDQVTASPALADLDGDGMCEVIVSSESDSVHVLRGDGTRYPGWPQFAFTNAPSGHTSSPVVADLDDDGNLDVIYAANDGRMYVWNRDGQIMPGWEEVWFARDALSAGVTQSTPTVADIDGDGWLEVVIGAENGYIYAWNHDGTEMAGFPITTGGEQRSAVTIWDVDADNLVELLATSEDRDMYVWDLQGEFRGDRIPWPFFRHDVRNTGRFDSEPLSGVGISDPQSSAPVAAAPVLYPAFPNPFNPHTTIRFLVPGEAGASRPVRLRIYDVSGRMVRELANGPLGTGEQAIVWDGRTTSGGRATSGAYFLRLEVSGQVLTGKATLIQ